MHSLFWQLIVYRRWLRIGCTLPYILKSDNYYWKYWLRPSTGVYFTSHSRFWQLPLTALILVLNGVYCEVNLDLWPLLKVRTLALNGVYDLPPPFSSENDNWQSRPWPSTGVLCHLLWFLTTRWSTDLSLQRSVLCHPLWFLVTSKSTDRGPQWGVLCHTLLAVTTTDRTDLGPQRSLLCRPRLALTTTDRTDLGPQHSLLCRPRLALTTTDKNRP